jgi:hypothetical protein
MIAPGLAPLSLQAWWNDRAGIGSAQPAGLVE